MEPIKLWPDLIYKTRCPLDLSEAAEIAAVACRSAGPHALEKGGGSSTYNTLNVMNSLPEFEELNRWMVEQSKKVWEAWGMIDMKRFVHRSWANVHPPGAYTDEHDHGSTHQVITLYLKKPENSGNIFFRDPMSYTKCAWPQQIVKDWFEVPCEQNDMLIFPGFLRHKTGPNESQEDRLVLTTNISIDFFYNYNDEK
jgi:uncharacterized protein (TIGR02466 family)